MQTVPHVQLTEALVAPRAERKPEAEIFGLLSEAMGVPPAFGAGTDAIALLNDGELAAHGLSVAELATRDRGLAVLETPPTDEVLSGRLQTEDRRIDCAPELVVRATERADALFEDLAAEPVGQLRLITRRTRNTLNSALANIGRPKTRGADTDPLWMHPDDDAARGLVAGDTARVHNSVGALVAPIALDPNLRPGVVAMTHGFGDAATPGMPTAHAHPGVNVNVLSPSGPGTFDPCRG